MERIKLEYLEHQNRRGLKKSTLKSHAYSLRVFFDFIGETYPDVKEITDITRDMVRSYEKYLSIRQDSRGKIMAQAQRARNILHIRLFFAYCEREEKILRNPASNVAIPRLRQTVLKDVLTIEEMEKLLKSCPSDDLMSIRDRAMMELLYSSGVRADELCTSCVEDIDLTQRLLHVRHGKMGKERIIPFGESAAYWVRVYLERVRPLIARKDAQEIFVSMRGRRLAVQMVCEIVKAYAIKAGIGKNVTSHTFRHSCATHMLKGGADIRYVQRQLGHRFISTTEKYLKIEITDLKEIHDRCHPREQEDW
jgi:integrase/recombinase XerD